VLGGCGRVGFTPVGMDPTGDAAGQTADVSTVSDPCPASRVIGTVCTGGGIYAGSFQGRQYMVTAPGCEDAVSPTCTGTDSNFSRTYDPAGTRIDMPELTNITMAATPSPTNERGDYNTPIIIDNALSAAGYCSDLMWGGFEDWYLPSKSELAYIFCKSAVEAASTSNPQSDPNCALVGGKTTQLTGWSTGVTRVYWSSTERDIQNAWVVDFYDGNEQSSIKNNPFDVRCVRSYP